MAELEEREIVREEALLATKAAAGDKPSIYALGLAAAKVLAQHGVVVLMTDIRGVVQIRPPSAVQVLSRALVPDEDLDQMESTEAIQLMLQEQRSEDEIVSYLAGREARGK